MKCAIAHIADIHYRKEESEGALQILNALIKDLAKQKDSLAGYDLYLAITGDVVLAGADSGSYLSFIKEFSPKLNEIGLTKDHVIVVPGNHDIDQSVVERDFERYKATISNNMENERKFNDSFNDEDYQDKKFDNYMLFESYFAGYGIDYSLPGKGWTLNSNLGVYCLNTSLCSFGGVNKVTDDALAASTRGIIDWCNTVNTSTNILLMHHPLSRLNSWSRASLRQIIENHFSLCLCGHNHEQDIFYNKISQKSLVCSAPQVFTNKDDLLGYAIILIEDNFIDTIKYREYSKGQFLNGQRFSENSEGIVSIQSDYAKRVEILKDNLKSALSFFKGQPDVFIEPKISKEREFNDEPNLLPDIIKAPRASVIASHPQFGLTCLSHYMRLEAYKANNFWVYLDSKHIKARNVQSVISGQIREFGKTSDEVACIIIDSWDSSIIDHRSILKSVDSEYKGIPIIVMSNYTTLYYDPDFSFEDLNAEFETLHLQAMQRGKVREFVSQYNKEKNIAKEDLIVEKVVRDLEALNVHRTPFNCLTLLKVLERDYNESLVNRTKMIKAVLFILFTDADSFTYSSNKPDVDDCEYILGRFCMTLVRKGTRSFTILEFFEELRTYCKEKLISVDLETMASILESNNILLRFGDTYEFKHSYWIFYFAANYMLHDRDFRDYVLNDKNYVNFPELIEFYTGIDGRRDDAICILLRDLNALNDTVNEKIGITNNFNPFEGVIWNPSEDTIEAIRKDISERVKNSNLPTAIKDQYADQRYNSEAPYDQSIRKFLTEYSVVSLIQSIKASSRALRNSNYVSLDLRKDMIRAILSGWEQISKVLFWLSPALAQKGFATYDGLRVLLAGTFEGSPTKKMEAIFRAIPNSVVDHLKDDLSSTKMGPLVFDCLESCKSIMQKHFLCLFLIKERPEGWNGELFTFMNLLHRNSFILGDLFTSIEDKIEKGFLSGSDSKELKTLLKIVAAKHEYAPKSRMGKIPKDMTINEENKLPIDKILAVGKSHKSIPGR